MKKMRKGKKMLLILFAVIIIALTVVLIALTVVLIVNIVNKTPGTPEVPDDTQQVIPLPQTTYSDMEVRNISMEYLKSNNETMVNMEIHNTTQNKVEDESLTAVLLDANGNILGQRATWIQLLDVGEQYDISVILEGDLTSTTQIKLMEIEK